MAKKKSKARTLFVALRLSKKEMKALRAKADADGSPMGSYIRRTLTTLGVLGI